MTEQQTLVVDDHYKQQVQNQWDRDACGSHYVQDAEPDTLEWYLQAEAYRYGYYGPWMPRLMEFDKHAGKQVLEIGSGLGTDLAQFAKGGAHVTDLDLSAGHLAHAKRNFELRGLEGTFVHGDGERLPFPDNNFDVVYSNGVIHHTPNTKTAIEEIYRVLKPGGKTIIMVYAENSLHYWRNLFRDIGVRQGQLSGISMGEIMSQSVEISEHGSRPLVKVYTKERMRQMFNRFERITIDQCQLVPEEMPRMLKWMSVETAGRLFGWNLVLKGYKPA